jgi:hypothetical protein
MPYLCNINKSLNFMNRHTAMGNPKALDDIEQSIEAKKTTIK